MQLPRALASKSAGSPLAPLDPERDTAAGLFSSTHRKAGRCWNGASEPPWMFEPL